jgi:hypothetical protein
MKRALDQPDLPTGSPGLPAEPARDDSTETLPRSGTAAKLLWEYEASSERTGYEKDYPHSPLPAVRDWLLGSNALDEGGLGFVLVEFIPYYDEPEGKRALRQEVLLMDLSATADARDFHDRLAKYNSVAGALQRNNLGLYQHDYITGAGMARCSGPVLVSKIDDATAADSAWEEREREWLRLKHAVVADALDALRAGPAPSGRMPSQATASPAESHEWEGHRYYWSAENISRVGILPDRDIIESMRRRARDEHGAAWPDDYQRTDLALTLDLAHEMLRKEFSVAARRASWLAMARLETNNRAGDEGEDEQGIPRSYRGAVWVYAEGAAATHIDQQAVLRNLLRTCLVAGNISVEAQAGDALANSLRRFATRTAAVAIMSRNMSHNLGSHVLSGAVSQKEAARLASDPIVSERHDLLRYLQERMDFLAEVSTGGAFMATPLSMESMLSSFMNQQLLRTYISGLARADGAPVNARLTSDPLARLLPGHDLLVLSPGGRNGCHALYVILENIIRNVAKHSHEDAPDKVEVSVRADLADDLVKVVIWDGARSADLDREGISTVEYLDSVIKKGEMITESGALTRGSWGMREMMIAAAYLRGVPLEEVDGRQLGAPLPLLRAIRVDDDGLETEGGDSANIGFELYLRRPQILCAIDQALARAIDPARLEELSRQGLSIHGSAAEALRLCRDFAYLAVAPGVMLARDSGWPHRRLEMTPALANILARTDIPPEALAEEAWRAAAFAWQQRLQMRHGLPELEAFAPDGQLGLPEWSVDERGGQQIIFLRHLPAEPRLKEKMAALNEQVFWEHYEGTSDQASLIENPPASAAEALRHELVAAGLARIVVLDERVQSAVEAHPGYFSGQLPKSQTLKRRRIAVPGTAICPLKSAIGWESLEAYLDSVERPVDIVVIHLGILERIVPRDGWTETLGKLLSWAERQGRGEEQKPEIVICSGRGPKDAQAVDQRFVTASAVERWTVHVPSKYHLYQLLASSRRPSPPDEAQA